MTPTTAAADTSPAGDAAAVSPHAAARRPLWPYAAFFVLAAVFGWQLLFAGRILLPTNPATVAPWTGDASPEAAAVPSNGLMMDTLIFTLPARVYNGAMLRAGELPFWNPHVFAGYPHFALIQNNALYPLSAPFDVVEPVSGMGYSLLLHLALAGCLMFAFLRAQGLDDLSACLGAAAFELNGMFLVRLSAPSYVFSGVWLPLMLLGALRLARGGRLRAGWPLLLATFLSVLGGHPQITSLCLTMAGAFLLLDGVARGGVARTVRAMVAFGVLAALGVGLAGFQVVPFLELMASSGRGGGEPLAVYRKSALPFTGLLQAIVPDVFGHPNEVNWWFGERAHLVDGIAQGERGWALNYCGQNLYTGIAPLVLAAVAVLRSPHRRAVVLFAATAIASLGVLLGTPLLDLAYAVLPGFRHSRPDRIVFLYMSALSVLTAYGFAALAGTDAREAPRTGSARRRLEALSLAAFLLAVVAWPIAPRLADPAARADLATWLADARLRWGLSWSALAPQVLATAALTAACFALAAVSRLRRLPRAAVATAWTLLLVVPSLLFGWRFNPMQHPLRLGETSFEQALLREASGAAPVRVARILPGLRQALPANTLQLLGVDDVHGASAAGVGGFLDLADAADPGAVNKSKYFRAFREPQVAQTRLLDLMNAGLVLTNVALPAPYQPLASEDGITLYRNPRALPRFFIVEQTQPYASPDEGRALLLAPDFDPARTVLLRVADDVTLPPPADAATSVPPAQVTVESATAHAIELRVTAPRPAILVSSEVAYPGWQTTLDGASVPTLLVDTAFRGVMLPAGTHKVEMRYVPRSFHAGVALSAVSLLLVAWLWRPRRAGAA